MPEYKSPQNESGNERNFLLVFLVMAVVIFGSQFFMKKFMPQPPATTAQATPQQQATPGAAQPAATVSAPNSGNPGSGKPVSGKQKSGKQSQQPALAPSKQATAESETVVENG